jgi:hypothetical protein
VPVELALEIGLTVVLVVPLWVANELVHEAPKLGHACGNACAAPPKALQSIVPDLSVAASKRAAATTEVPDAFCRDFPV